MNPQWVTLAAGFPGIATLALLVWDRVRRRNREGALSEHDLTELRRGVEETSALAASVARENISCAEQRAADGRRIGVLEGGNDKIVAALALLREEFVIYRASNDMAHKAVGDTLDRQGRMLEQMQAQIRNVALGGADAMVELKRQGRGGHGA